MGMQLVVIDNYDSFTFNLVHLFGEFDLEVRVYRHDVLTVEGVRELDPDWICISPGPKDPAHAGISKEVIRRLGPSIPILGVCLGMQAINEVFGGRTTRAPLPVHGKRCLVHHRGEGLFSGITSPFQAARYHSLQAVIGSRDIAPLAFAEDGVVMALRHRRLPIMGVQFHPESFLSEYGLELVANFLAVHPGRGVVPAVHSSGQDRFPRWAAGAEKVPGVACKEAAS
jgi:anthranilate synthase component 2